MSDQETNDESPEVNYEGGVPIIRRLSEVERKQNESERHDAEYKRDQICLNKRLVKATVALVVSTVVLGVVQAFYMHRQWKLTSGGLSKMGDQIWAAKDAAYAAKGASDTASQAFQRSQEQFNNTLAQMKAQTTAQQGATDAAISAAQTAKITLENSEKSFQIEQRPYVVLESDRDPRTGERMHYQFSPGPEQTIPFQNVGRTQAIDARVYGCLTPIPASQYTPQEVDDVFAEAKTRLYDSSNVPMDVAPYSTGLFTRVRMTNVSCHAEVHGWTSAVDQQQSVVLVIAGVVYTDTFRKKTYETEICFVWHGYDPEGNDRGFTACPAHNIIR